MELKLERSHVLQELSVLQGVVERRTTIPILSKILAEGADGLANGTSKRPVKPNGITGS